MIRELVPSDLHKIQSFNDWKRSIVAAYNQDAGMSPDDAKITFLKIVYRYDPRIKHKIRLKENIKILLNIDGPHLDQHFSK